MCLVILLCLSLCYPMDCSLPGSSVHGILQARILEWVAIPYSRGSSWPRDWTHVSCIAGRLYCLNLIRGNPHSSYNWKFVVFANPSLFSLCPSPWEHFSTLSNSLVFLERGKVFRIFHIICKQVIWSYNLIFLSGLDVFYLFFLPTCSGWNFQYRV